MAFIPLRFKPGINRDITTTADEGGWYECDKVRFRQGLPEKLGGWAKYSANTFLGTCRATFGWVTSYQDNFLAMGTEIKAYIEAGGVFNDITPLRTTLTTTATDNCIATTNGSTTVVVNVTAHGCDNNSYVTIVGSTAVGGVPNSELNVEHKITKINDDSFSITVTTAATSTVAAGGGTGIDIECQLNPGFAATTLGYGWGTGLWGRTGWGSGSTPGINLGARYWWFDNFDNDLVFNYTIDGYGVPYIWQRGTIANPNTSLSTRAIPLADLSGATDVPTYVGQVLVSQNDKHLLAFGATPYGGGDFDPMLIRWASQDAPEDWTPEATNSAGFIRVSRGSVIKRAFATRQEILIFTDTGLHSLQFTGTTDVFSLQELNNNISIMSSRAVATANNVVFWMGHDKFYMYSGRVDTLPTTLWKHVYQNFNYGAQDAVVAGTNEGFNEVWWLYPTGSSTNPNAYVVFNYVEKLWYYGTLERDSWLDSGLREYPQATANGYIYNHEYGINADNSAMESYIESADFDLGDGEKFMITRRIIPDISFSGSTATTPEVDIQLKARNFPGANTRAETAERVIRTTATTHTPQVHMRARGRSATFKVSSDTTGVQWQLGVPRLDAREDGKR